MPADETWGLPGSRLSRRLELYGTATRVAARYGALQSPVPARSPRGRQRALTRAHEAGARDLYRTAVHLRGGFLKLGQFASARPDLLPEAYVRELSKLQDRVPPAPAAVIRSIVERHLGPTADHFASFDSDSASAASLAQVHRAERVDGRAVAVKVQYPRVPELVPPEARDTTRLLGMVDKIVGSRLAGLPMIGRALEESILSEIDYPTEASNIERFAANFADEPRIVVPAVHHDLTTGPVLTMDWIEGDNLARALRHVDHDVAQEATRLLVDSYLKQILVDGFLHADPHPGNFLLRNGDGDDPPELGFVDFGACATIPEATRLGLRQLYQAGIEADLPTIGAALYELGFRTRSGDVQSLVAWVSLFSFEGDEADRQSAWATLMGAAREDPVVRIPPELVMVGRVLIVQTGLVSRIKPTWSMEELIAERLDL